MTLKDYASSRGITYEAVRQLVKKLRPGIDEHITKSGRTRILDDIAVKMLDDRRNESKVSVIHTDTSNQIETIDQLKNEIIILQRQLLTCQNDLRIASENASRLEAVSIINERQQSEIDTLKSDNESLKNQLGKYRKTIFGLYIREK